MPINYVTHPGVSVTAACFGNGTYSAVSASTCISNLLAAQYRRLILDLYWDTKSRDFGLCPVALPSSAQTTTTISPSAPLATAAHVSTVKLSRSSTAIARDRRQNTSATSIASETSNLNATSTSTSAQTPIATLISSSGETLYSLGPYRCGQNLTLGSLQPLISGYLQNTSDTIHARLIWLEFNLHAAASTDAPGGPAKAPSNEELPSGTELVGQQLNNTLQSYIYSPRQLGIDRSDLNSSWYHVSATELPVSHYYSTSKLANGVLTTPDGWPTEAYILFNKATRLSLGWGTVDPQMQNYTFSNDSGTIFPQDYLSAPRLISPNSAGELKSDSGCFFDSGIPSVALSNSSWAVSGLNQTIVLPLSSLTDNLTACGISPILNKTLSGMSADRNVDLYASFARYAIWSWAPGEPRNTSAPNTAEESSPSQFRCALMDTSSAYTGHWRVGDCPDQFHSACRVQNRPYEWVLSDEEISFSDAPYSCPENATFSAPRTGLENQHLYRYVLSRGNQADPIAGGPIRVWVNFNSLDTESCWIATGPNGTCPYYVDETREQSREILVPTIAAIIVFVLTALTVFVKCNVNRRNSRARKRGDGGWDYEGVPS